MSNDKPQFEHDCNACKFLGRAEHFPADLYFCPQGNIPTIIARFSSDPSDYSSGMEFGKVFNEDLRLQNEPLAQAYRIALAQKLILK